MRQIARENGYGPQLQDIQDTEILLGVVTQARQTDAQFVRRLADREGFEFYVDFDGLHFHERRLGQRPLRVLRWYTAPDVGEVISINIENDVTAKPGAVRMRGRDPLTRRDIDERGSNTTTPRDTLAPIVEIVAPETGATRIERRNISEDVRPTAEASPGTARREAHARYRRTQHSTVRLTLVVLGDPNLLAKIVLEIQGIGTRLSGKYYVKDAKHTIAGSGYTTEMKCLRDGHSEVAGAASRGKPNHENAADADPAALRPVEIVDPESGRTRVEYRDDRGRGGGRANGGSDASSPGS